MHLLAASPGAPDDALEPVDLAQTPAELVVLTAADTEIASLADARAAMPDPPGLRLGNLMQLRHPLAVDMHLDTCATGARLVVARVLGGASYWRYGVEQYAARLAEAGVPLALLPGDDKPDPELRGLSTVADADYDALWSYLVEGGPANATGFLAHARHMIHGTEAPRPAAPLLRAGPHWPGEVSTDLDAIRAHWPDGAPVVPVIFYRALVQGGGLAPIAKLTRALLHQGLAPLPIYVASLKDPVSRGVLDALFAAAPPEVIVNLTSFATGTPDRPGDNPLVGAHRAPVLQAVLSGGTAEVWAEGTAGLSGRDIAMNVALPEVDGRIPTRAVAFKDAARFDEATQCPIATWRADPGRCAFVAAQAAGLAKLRRTRAAERKVSLILANYPNKDGRLANGVGLDTPQATVDMLGALSAEGYAVEGAPDSAQALMDRLMAGPTNWRTDRADRAGGEALPLDLYRRHYAAIPHAARQALEARWGAPEDDPFVEGGAFRLSIHRFGNAVVALQPARGYNVDPVDTYHAPDLVPPHHYLAFHIWLRHVWGADALAHMGKHGNLEWLPGKALALSDTCWPEVALGPTPNVYPFIVNDPGEGTQAKRRASAVIVDHLTPPLTRAESYGPLRDLEALVDEYYEAAGVDPRRAAKLREDILSLATATGIAQDAGVQGDDLTKLDAWLCELKEAQIRDGLHVFGTAPEGRLARDLTIALARIPRGEGASLLRAMADDLGLGFDPLSATLSEPWSGPRPDALTGPDAWRSAGDTVERLELLAQRLLDGAASAPGPATRAVMDEIATDLAPRIRACGPAERRGFLDALAGLAVAPGPSGAPTRGRPDVLPTGRNFFSVDSRALPTPTAWALGWKSADLLIERHLQDHGDWPRAMLVTAWGTACMRTGGDDVAQAMALMGVKPVWDAANRRVTGFEVVPLGALGRPRVDVTLRISGFFRDAFPQLVDLFDAAARAVQAQGGPDNPAADAPGPRVYGSKPGAYGAGLQAMIDERVWSDRADLGAAYVEWGGYAYGVGTEGRADHDGFRDRLRGVEAIVQNQDNREHDLLDSDDYYQFEGGAAAAVEALQGHARPVYHNDHSRPERPVIRTLDEEVARVLRSRVVNPKWIAGVMRHGYKGAFEIAATVDYLFAFAATTGAVRDHHFDAVAAAVIEDDAVRTFIEGANAPALREIAQRLEEAIDRDLWTPRSNAIRGTLEALSGTAAPA
ncbi:MAG: cobaltochelatase subunit CobN [Paracoccaceae bacterium]